MAKVHAKYLLIKTKSIGVDPLVDKILTDTPENAPTRAAYDRVRSCYNSAIKKSYIEACLIASRDLESISKLIEMSVEDLALYREIFFNIEGFDKLSLLEVIEDSDSIDEKGMKIWALNQGLDFVAWRLGKAVTVNPVIGLQDLFTLSVFKSKEALFSGSSSDAGKAATAWTKLSMDLARLLKAWVSDADAAKSDIQMALKTLTPTFAGFDGLASDDVNPDLSNPTDLPSLGSLDSSEFPGLPSN